MVLTAHSKPGAREKIPAVIHADGTGRIQIVRAEDDPLTYAYLKALGRRIGVEMSVNTSFNVAGPIAQTPNQAIETLRRSKGLDAVLLVADDGAVTAAWHGGERDSGRFTGWLSEWNSAPDQIEQAAVDKCGTADSDHHPHLWRLEGFPISLTILAACSSRSASRTICRFPAYGLVRLVMTDMLLQTIYFTFLTIWTGRTHLLLILAAVHFIDVVMVLRYGSPFLWASVVGAPSTSAQVLSSMLDGALHQLDLRFCNSGSGRCLRQRPDAGHPIPELHSRASKD